MKIQASEFLTVREDDSGSFWSCARCSTYLGELDQNYKDRCASEIKEISACNPLVGDPADFIDDKIEFRQFHCPNCGSLLENEVAVASDPVLADIELKIG